MTTNGGQMGKRNPITFVFNKNELVQTLQKSEETFLQKSKNKITI